MQVKITSRDEIKLTLNACELGLISYALSYFGQNGSTANFRAGDLQDAIKLGDETFNAYTVVVHDQAEIA